SQSISRRDVLALGAGVVGSVALAGCGGGTDDAPPTSGATASSAATTSALATTPASTSAAPSTPAPPTPPPAPTAPPTPPPAAAPPAGAILRLSEVPVGGSASATVGGNPVLIAQPTAGTAVGFSAICTHEGCTVPSGGERLTCACHGSMFNAFTGAVLGGPA